MNVPNPDFGIPRVDYTPAHIVQRRVAAWRGLWAEAIELTQSEPYEYDFQAPFHLLIAMYGVIIFTGIIYRIINH